MKRTWIILLVFLTFFTWAKTKQENQQECHKYFSVNCFNECWNYLAADSLSGADSQKMVLLASSSLWHWQQRPDVSQQNLSIGYWQLAKAYVKAKMPVAALKTANTCLEISLKAELEPFYVGYAYEALACTYLLNGNTSETQQNLAAAEKYLSKIKDEEEKQYLQADLKKLEEKLAE